MKKRRRRFSPLEKAGAVRKHVRDKIPVSKIADEMQVQPTQIHYWVNSVLLQAERAFVLQKHAKTLLERNHSSVTNLQEKLDAKNAVIAEIG